MTAPKKAPLLPSSRTNSNSISYQSLHHNPLADLRLDTLDKENVAPVVVSNSCSIVHCLGANACKARKSDGGGGCAKPQQIKPPLDPSSLQQCMKLNEPQFSSLGVSRPWVPVSSSSDMWEFSDSESAPASSWSTLSNRSLLYRPLPLDVGRCTCIIVIERAQGTTGMILYSLYTYEGKGRQDRKLAVARHRRRHGRSEFIVAQNPKGIFCNSDESFLGTITANLMGSKYHILDQGRTNDSVKNHSRQLLGFVAYVPTITTISGSFRSIRASIPKQHSMQLKSSNSTQIRHINGLPKDWEQKPNGANQLVSRVPYYNSFTKRYELDFRGGRAGQKIQTSVKNFQLTMEEKGRQTILQLGRIGKSKYVMDYRYPLTGFQAFCICLTSIDSKLCCSM